MALGVVCGTGHVKYSLQPKRIAIESHLGYHHYHHHPSSMHGTSWPKALRPSVPCSYHGGDVAQLVRASDRHAADAGSIPLCGKGFFSQSQLSVQILLRVSVHSPCAIACINICAHVKDVVVHVRGRWIMETLKHPVCTVGWVARLCRSWLFPGESNPNFPWEKSRSDNTVVKSKSKFYF